MMGPEHYVQAEHLLAVADRHSNGATYGQERPSCRACPRHPRARSRHGSRHGRP